MRLRDVGLDHAAEAGRRDRSVAEMRAELAEAERQAEQAQVLAVEQAKAAEAERVKAEREGKDRLAALTREASVALPDTGPVLAQARLVARQFLHPGEDMGASDALERLRQVDLVVGVLLDRQRHAGQLMQHLAEDAGLAEDHALYQQADELECAAWRAVVGRAAVLAGEV